MKIKTRYAFVARMDGETAQIYGRGVYLGAVPVTVEVDGKVFETVADKFSMDLVGPDCPPEMSDEERIPDCIWGTQCLFLLETEFDKIVRNNTLTVQLQPLPDSKLPFTEKLS